jgi:hypothetical protein
MEADGMLAIAPFRSLSAGQQLVEALVVGCEGVAGLRDRNDSARLHHSDLTSPNSYTKSFTAGIKSGSTMWKIVLRLPIWRIREPTHSLWMPPFNIDEVF